ncbi:MAG: poly-beta-1,6 N-acetyl-D-glucosamine export porin PgaA [Alphaproteobacteria bacterium]
MLISEKQKFISRIVLSIILGSGVLLFSAQTLAQWAQQSAGPQPANEANTSPTPRESAEAPMPTAAPDAAPNLDQPAAEPVKTAKPKTKKRVVKKAAPKVATSTPRPAWSAEHDAAVKEARNGNTGNSVVTLKKLYEAHPNDAALTRDYLVVLSWDGSNDAEVVRLYKTLNADQPDYVLEAVGHAYRGIGQPDEARAIYERGLSRNPKSEAMAAGVIYSLTDSGYVDQALNMADANIQQYGARVNVLLAAANAADVYGQNDKAISYYQAAWRIAPKNAEAIRGVIRTQSRMGNPEDALRLADENPGVLPQSEYRMIQADVAANMVRKGMENEGTESQRFATTDRAIARYDQLIAEWSKLGPEARPELVHARQDRIIALVNRSRMQEAVQEYEALVKEGVKVPTYVQSSAADAYLYLRQPEKARDMYLEVLKTDPKNFNVRRQLFYAYVECDDYESAFWTIDDLMNDKPYWVKLNGQDDPRWGPQEKVAMMVSGSGRLYSGQIQEADDRLRPLAMANMNNAMGHEILGNLASAHGWPRQALEHYKTAVSMHGGQHMASEAAMVSNYLKLQKYPEAEAKAKELVARAPENLSARRAKREWDVHDMAEIRVNVGYAFEPMTSSNVTGGEGYGIDTMIYSPPIGYNWRIFAGEYFAHQREPNAEGTIDFSRTILGGEYRKGDYTVSLAPTFNWYDGSRRIGGMGEGTVALNDNWTVAASGEIFSRNTPLRALNAGTTADFANLRAVWRQDEHREVRFGGNIMPFSDGNFRSGLDASYSERIHTTPHFSIDGLADVGESQNSKDSNRLYYNPSFDFIALAGARATHVLYQRYGTAWQHSVRLTPGLYYQDKFGTDAAIRARYEHRMWWNNVIETGIGVNYSRQSYDGVPENDVSLSLDFTGHF